MILLSRRYQTEDDFWRIRDFLRQVFLLNDRLERSWHVARIDYLRWHFCANCHVIESMEKGILLWETDREIAAVVNDFGAGEIRIHIHPRYCTPEFQNEIFGRAEERFSFSAGEGRRIIFTPVFVDDTERQQVLAARGYTREAGKSHHWHRDLNVSLPNTLVPDGYLVRSMGTVEEHPARSLASWKAFHNDEPDENYDGDFSWYRNIQSAPLYRRDLDIVAIGPMGEVAAFCTIYYDDYTRSAVCVLVGTAAGHQRRGLAKSVVLEGMRRLKGMGCTRVFATAYDPPANALYRSVMQVNQIAETWLKEML